MFDKEKHDKTFDSIELALKDFKEGKPVIIVDDENRENEGDLVFPAEDCSREKINFMISECKGLICAPISKKIADKLELNLMANRNTEKHSTKFTVSVDAKEGTTTGISASDRCITIRKIASEETKPEQLLRPGHIFPIIASKQGLFGRKGHTEAAIDLCRITGKKEAGVICEIIKENGEMARLDDLIKFKKKHDLKLISIPDIISYRLKNEKILSREAETLLPTSYGEFRLIAYKNKIDNGEHLALVKGSIKEGENILARIHSKCLTGDAFHSLRCDCHDQLTESIKKIEKEGKGVIIYLDQEGRGIGLANKIKTYELHDKGLDTVESMEKLGFKPDLRDYSIGARIFNDLKIKSIKLLTNNPKKIEGLKHNGIEVKERIPIITKVNKYNKDYVKTKEKKLGHLFPHQ